MLDFIAVLGSILPVLGIVAIAAYFMDWRASPSQQPAAMLPAVTPAEKAAMKPEVVTVTTPDA